jgi:hypothetical protein
VYSKNIQILCSYIYRIPNYFTSENQIAVQTKFAVIAGNMENSAAAKRRLQK